MISAFRLKIKLFDRSRFKNQWNSDLENNSYCSENMIFKYICTLNRMKM